MVEEKTMRTKYPSYYAHQMNPYSNMRVNPSPRHNPRMVEDYTPQRAMADMTGMVVMGAVTLGAVGLMGSLIRK